MLNNGIQFGSNRVWVLQSRWETLERVPREAHHSPIGWDDLGDLNEFHNVLRGHPGTTERNYWLPESDY